MELIAAWLFLLLQLTLLYLFWIASLQASKPRFSFDIGGFDPTTSVVDNPTDDKLESELDLTKAEDVKEPVVGDVKKEKTELQIWGQNTISKWGSEESMERKRSLIINEIIQTEESYLNSLHQLKDVWIMPMTKSAEDRSNGLTMKEIEMLSFNSVMLIINLHDALLPQLRSATDVGATFVKFGQKYGTCWSGFDVYNK